MFKTMLVEDSTSFRQIVKDNLQDQFPSMDITEAEDGVEAFQKIDSRPPNLILMDITLPGENGLELTRKIKADYPGVIIIILDLLPTEWVILVNLDCWKHTSEYLKT
jgi:CheY-like chemotaxis protein